jgi:MYXO-CTERM domain-containing protein
MPLRRAPLPCLPAALVASALALIAPRTFAQVTEPNGMTVPVNGNNGEIELNTFFASRGESIDWQADAHDTPNQFSPLCGFSATYVLNQAGSHFGLSWYNDTGTMPTAADLFPLVPANSAVGATFNGTSIKNDPNYKGGVVGFALVGGETHYTNASYDNECTGCSPPGPWITALMYASTLTPDAYYVCFEDGATSAAGWNNDGDFNDDVYFVTGVSCLGGGQPCDTGLQGICAPGLTQCTATGTTCKEINPPATTETCNGLDDNCNGTVDEGAMCPSSEVCEMGRCVPTCGEGVCPSGTQCTAGGTCVDTLCIGVMCPTGQVCEKGACKGPCDGITCPYPQTCRVGLCVDPCAGVTCDSGQVCSQGVCIPSCACQPCATGQSCNTTTGLCGAPACATVSCPAGQFCKAGACVDDCTGAVCPENQTCTGGTCVEVTDAGADSGPGLTAPDGGFGGGADSGLTSPGADGGAKGDAGSGASFGGGGSGSSSGCGCRSVDSDATDNPVAWAVAALLLAATRRRRRPRGSC